MPKRGPRKTQKQDNPSSPSQWMDVVPDLCFLLDRQGTVLASNRLARREIGCTEKELHGHPVWSFLSEGSEGPLRDLFRKAGRARNGQEAEVRFQRKDGTPLEAIAHVRPFRDGKDPDVAFALVAQNVSEQKDKELRFLQFSEVIHRTINPIQITDASGRMVYVNPAFEKASGFTREDLIGKNPNVLSSGKHPKEFWRQVWETILAGKVWVGEVENRRKNGEPLHTQILISPIVDAEGKVVGFLGAHRDITEQKKLETQLFQSQKMESIGTLAAGIAHEVGNPLTSISSLVQVIQRSSQDEFAKDKLELVKNQINRISNTIRQLVDFSRPSNYEPQRTDVNRAIRDAVGIVRYGKKAKDVQFHLSLTDPLPKILVVHDQIIQVFINILINAVDAFEGERREVKIETKRTGKTLEVTFEDTGRGIPFEQLQKIFDPFYTTKKPGEGTGLGLWVSYGIVKNFGGDIRVESQPGKGSIFTVQIPIPPGEEKS